MANEFVIKNGFHSKGDSQVTGSLDVSGSITGSLYGTSSWAESSSYSLTASYVNLAESASYINPTFISASVAASGFGVDTTDISALNTFTGSIQTEVNNLTSATSSYVLTSVTSSMTVLSSSFATTASYINPTFISESAAASGFGSGGGSGAGFPYVGDAVITGSLVVSGSGNTGGTINRLVIGVGGGTVSTNVAIGSSSLLSNVTGYQNTAIGVGALSSTRVERNHIAIGFGAMQFASASAGDNDFGNAAIGAQAGRYMTGSRNVAIGYQAMYQSTGFGARLSVAIGYQALYGAGGGANGDYNMAIGYRSMYNAGTVGQNLAFGYSSLESLKSGTGNLVIGNRAMQFASASNDVVAIGRVALQNAKRASQLVAIGESAMLNQYPTDTGTSITAATIAIGYKALQGVAGNANTGVRNTAIGDNSMQFNSTANDNTAIGYFTLNRNLSGSNNVAIGSNAMTYALVSESVAIGYYSGRLVSGSNNVAIGPYALNGQWSSTALNSMDNNTAIGYSAGRYISSSAGNVFIGYNAGPPAVGGDAKTVVNNKLYIANAAGNPLIGGDFAAKTVTISGSLYISGSIIPNADATLTSSFELGSPTAAWNRIWVRSSSIHFVDDLGNELAKISANPAGAIEMPNIYTSGTFTAQTFVTQSTTTIIEVFHATGSNQFGSSSLDTHQFTGSVYISGGLEQTSGNASLRNTTVNGNFVATESVYLTGLQNSNQSYLVSIDPGSGQLYYTASEAFAPANVDIAALATTGSNAFYGSQTIYDSDSIISFETSTGIRRLYDFNTNTSIDWANRVLYDDLNIPSINYDSRELRDESSTTLLEYSNNQIRLTQDVLMTGLSQDIADSVIVIDSTTGQLYYTSSTAFVANIGDVETYLGPLNTFSSSILTFTSSIQNQVNNLTSATSSYILNSVTSSMSVLSSSYALTASYALNAPVIDTSIFVTTASFNSFTGSIQTQVNDLTSNTSSYVVNSVTSSMLAPYVLSSNTASFVTNSQTGSMTVAVAGTASLVNTVGTNAGSTNHIVFTNIASSNANTLYTDAGGGLTFNPGTNVLSTTSIVASNITGSLRGHVTTSSIDTRQYTLYNSGLGSAINWDTGIIGHPDTRSIDWLSRYLHHNSNSVSVDWQNRILYTAGGATGLDWSGDYVSISNVYSRNAIRIAEADVLSNTLYEYSGQSIRTTIDVSSTPGELIYLHTDGIWYPVDQAGSSSSKMLGINIDGDKVLIDGDITLDTIQNANYGLPVYIRESGTTFSTTIPTSGTVRVVGHCYHDNTGTPGQWVLKFRPSNDWYSL